MPAPRTQALSPPPSRVPALLPPPRAAVRWLWIGIFAVAAVLRLVHVLVLVNQPVFWDANTQGGSDMSGFIEFATRLAADGGFWDARSSYTTSAPLFPLTLAAWFHLVGPDLALAALAQAALGAATCLVVGWGAWQLFGERRVAYLTAALAAIYGPFIFYTTKLHATTVELATAALAFACIAWAVRGSGAWRWLAAGLALGVAALGRPTFMPVAGVVGGACLLWPGRPFRERVGAAAMLGLGAAAVVVAWMVRTVLVGGPWVPITGQTGLVWRLANSYDSYVLNFRYPRQPLMPVTSLAFWAHQLEKAALFWWGYEVPQNMNYYFIREFSPILRLPVLAFWVVTPLAWLGLWWSRARWRELLPYHAAMAGYWLATSLFLIAARYRIPIVPALMPFAAFALAGLWDRARAGGWRAAAGPALACLVLMAAVNPHRERLIHSTEYAYIARDAVARGDGARAQWALERGIRLFPRALGERAESATAALRAVRDGAGAAPMPEGRRHLYLGIATLLTEGPPRAAREHLRQAATGLNVKDGPTQEAMNRLLASFASQQPR